MPSNRVNLFTFRYVLNTGKTPIRAAVTICLVLKITSTRMNDGNGAWPTYLPRRRPRPASYSFLPPSYDTHRQFDYGVCVQHFGEHVSDDRRKRGREEGRRIIGNRDTQQREGNDSRMRTPM